MYTEISPRCSFEGLMLKLKLQYFGHLMQRADSLKKTLMLEKSEVRRRRGRQRMRWLDGITGLNGHEYEQTPGDTWCVAVHAVAESETPLALIFELCCLCLIMLALHLF